MTEAIRDADEDSFAELIEPHRRELHAHCYRMLGSVHDADDALQEALLGAWKGRSGIRGAQLARAPGSTRSPPTPVSASSTGRRGASCRVAPAAGTIRARPSSSRWPSRSGSSPTRTSSCATRTGEGVELAYVAALQLLPPKQRAVLLLRDVLGFSARETAEISRDLGRLGEQRSSSGPARSSRASLRPVRSRRRCGRWATSAPASSWPASSTPGTAPTSRRSSRC